MHQLMNEACQISSHTTPFNSLSQFQLHVFVTYRSLLASRNTNDHQIQPIIRQIYQVAALNAVEIPKKITYVICLFYDNVMWTLEMDMQQIQPLLSAPV